ncbi:hypothetical protein SDRG_09275 [Saprolegnia diclina VS20]|uniref:30S ribosomal protein S21 n=1 Tax=Saprolegnia diclina (strain VS20) TaxID=1156394 RepID=T0Q5Z5_SAPDV|nr:hypothetical protein SDRG_09275 [Saprolegnia diclina VS20]EQC33294.1 hypothetical protein SDRG_09275 [Saprolegnia diclina VS20]|eukprot:XP_008613417.1 hypothetical protein SDRG_09275 [Saprolegnia diclina VS20]
MNIGAKSVVGRVAPSLMKMQTRSLWFNVEGKGVARVLREMNSIQEEDGIFKELNQRQFHEKKWQRRIRKKAESDIRHVNRELGTIIHQIFQRKKTGQ